MQHQPDIITAIDDVHRATSTSQRDLLSLLAEADRQEIWRHEGARDVVHWVQMLLGISGWKADRWLKAAHALESGRSEPPATVAVHVRVEALEEGEGTARSKVAGCPLRGARASALLGKAPGDGGGGRPHPAFPRAPFK